MTSLIKIKKFGMTKENIQENILSSSRAIAFLKNKSKLENSLVNQILNSFQKDFGIYLAHPANSKDKDAYRQVEHKNLDSLLTMKASELYSRQNKATSLSKMCERQIEELEKDKTLNPKSKGKSNFHQLNQDDIANLNRLKNYLDNESKICQALSKQRTKEKKLPLSNLGNKVRRFFGFPKKLDTEHNPDIQTILKSEKVLISKIEVDNLVIGIGLKALPNVDPNNNTRNNNRGGNSQRPGPDGNNPELPAFPKVPSDPPKLVEIDKLSKNEAGLLKG